MATAAHGKFEATVTPTADGFAYRLSCAGLDGDVTQAHIRFGQRGVAGGITDVSRSRVARAASSHPARRAAVIARAFAGRDGRSNSRLDRDSRPVVYSHCRPRPRRAT